MISVCARVLPHVDLNHGTFEQVLQSAFAASGIMDAATADDLARSMFIDYPSLTQSVRERYPDFDPAQLSILTPRVGLPRA